MNRKKNQKNPAASPYEKVDLGRGKKSQNQPPQIIPDPIEGGMMPGIPLTMIPWFMGGGKGLQEFQALLERTAERKDELMTGLENGTLRYDALSDEDQDILWGEPLWLRRIVRKAENVVETVKDLGRAAIQAFQLPYEWVGEPAQALAFYKTARTEVETYQKEGQTPEEKQSLHPYPPLVLPLDSETGLFLQCVVEPEPGEQPGQVVYDLDATLARGNPADMATWDRIEGAEIRLRSGEQDFSETTRSPGEVFLEGIPSLTVNLEVFVPAPKEGIFESFQAEALDLDALYEIAPLRDQGAL